MANQIKLFMNRDDERALLQYLERFVFEVYPRRVPPDWETFRARPSVHDQLPEEDLYLVATDLGAAVVDKVKRGPDKGHWRIDEVRSPVIFWQRSRLNEEGELMSGQLWAELDITAQTGRKNAAPDRFRALFVELEQWLSKTFRRGRPKPWLVGPATARAVKEGLVLRVDEHRGGTVEVHK
ncbi:MAG: hypothetical protein IPJ65_31130 [Archangiaceae bacterium]|nr:hypothetical protein [Archangiaceae bacterium]